MAERDLPGACLHCRGPIPAGDDRARFCCQGCESVYRLLHEHGLSNYYALAGDQVAPVAEAPQARGHAWLEAEVARAEAGGGALCELNLDVQGIHCAACVWVMNELYRRAPGGVALQINPALGSARLHYRRGEFAPARFIGQVEAFGYRFGPARKMADAKSVELPLRLGVSAALTMNVMLFSVSFYLGLTPEDGALFELFTRLSVWMSTAVVLIGGWPFFRAAVQGLRGGVLHLDLPIALGILLVFGTSLAAARGGRGDLAYFDTLNTFVTLMLVGRWLQQRVLDRNRRLLLEDDGADGLFVQRIEGERLCTVPAARLREGDVLLVAPGELAPVEGELLDEAAQVSTAWISGESRPEALVRGQSVCAGASNVGRSALTLRARTDLDASPLLRLLRAAPAGTGFRSPFWSGLSRAWVVAVLLLAGAGALAWWTTSPSKALQVAAALLVVTCPCALGIATPLAYELIQARLRRAGVFVRSGDLLDRLPHVRKLLFDKTGTVTLGRLEVADPAQVSALPEALQALTYALVARSSHPVSRCLAQALEREGARFDPEAQVTEVPGQGLALLRDGHTWRLGRAASAAPGLTDRATVLSRDGVKVAAFTLRESLRPDARGELQALASEGYGLWLISGDQGRRVAEVAAQLEIPAARTLHGQTPEEKAAAVARLDAGDTLFLGDGVNDSLAFEAALCAGTPAVDRPVMPGRADFYLLGEGLHGLRRLLADAKSLRGVVHRLLGRAVAYNVIAVGLCLAGWMTPLRAAVVMPLSSVSLVAYAVWAVRRSAPAAHGREAGPNFAIAAAPS